MKLTSSMILSLFLMVGSISATVVHKKVQLLKTAAESEGCLLPDDLLQDAVDVTNCIGSIPLLDDAIGIPNQILNCEASICLSKDAPEVVKNVIGCLVGFVPIVGSYFAAMGCPLFNGKNTNPTRRYMVWGEKCYQGVGGSNYDCRKAVAANVNSSYWKQHVDVGTCPFNFVKITKTETKGNVEVTTFDKLPPQKTTMTDVVGRHVCIKSPARERRREDPYAAVYGRSSKSLGYTEHCGDAALWEILPIKTDNQEWFQIKNIDTGRYLTYAKDTSNDPSTTSSSSSSDTHIWVETKGSGKFCLFGHASNGSSRRYIVQANEFSGNDYETATSCYDDQIWEITKIDTLCSDIPHLENNKEVDWYSDRGKSYTCAWYQQAPGRCLSNEGNRSNFGHTAKKACCVCGGGQRLVKK